MKCQKCGADIAENSKFCGYCGNSVSVSEPINQNINIEEGLGNVVNIDPVISNEQNIMNQSIQNSQPIESMNTQMNMQGPNNSTAENFNNIQMNMQTSQNNNNKKLLFIVGGVILAIVAIVVVAFAFTGSSKNSVKVLEKALANFEQTANNSGTIDAKLSIGTMGTNIDLSGAIKFQKISEDKINMLLSVNKSLMTDEMNIYAEMGKNEITAYIESTLLDITGETSSVLPIWLYEKISLDEIVEENPSENLDISLDKFIDIEHFIYVDENNDLKHYQLIIDNELIQKISDEAKKIGISESEEIDETFSELTETYKIDFYITKSNELKKVELDLSESFIQMGITWLVLSIEFSGLNNTVVEIPNEVKSATMTIEEYSSKYAVEETEDDFDTDFDNSEFDSGMDNTLDYDWNTEFDSNTNYSNELEFGL